MQFCHIDVPIVEFYYHDENKIYILTYSLIF